MTAMGESRSQPEYPGISREKGSLTDPQQPFLSLFSSPATSGLIWRGGLYLGVTESITIFHAARVMDELGMGAEGHAW